MQFWRCTRDTAVLPQSGQRSGRGLNVALRSRRSSCKEKRKRSLSLTVPASGPSFDCSQRKVKGGMLQNSEPNFAVRKLGRNNRGGVKQIATRQSQPEAFLYVRRAMKIARLSQ
jgi:hypothetical protein